MHQRYCTRGIAALPQEDGRHQKAEMGNSAEEAKKKKADKDERQLSTKVALTNKIAELDGVWCTETMVNAKFESLCNSRSDDEVRRAIHAQLQFHQKILKSKSPRKECFQLTTSVDGKVKKFTKYEMKQHLMEVIAANNLPSDPTLIQLEPASEAPRPVTYTDADTQQQSYSEVKQKMCEKLTLNRESVPSNNPASTWIGSLKMPICL